MSQPGEESGVALQKKTILERKWTVAKARLHNIIGCMGKLVSNPYSAPSILKQLDQAKEYMLSVFDEITSVLTPAKQDEFIEDFNKQENAYFEARSKLLQVKKKISVNFPTFANTNGKSFFTFFQSAILFDAATGDEERTKYLKQLAPDRYRQKSIGWDEYFRAYKHDIASEAALEMLELKQMPLTPLLERFRRCIFLLSLTGHDRDWKFLVQKIMCKSLSKDQHESAMEELEILTDPLSD